MVLTEEPCFICGKKTDSGNDQTLNATEKNLCPDCLELLVKGMQSALIAKVNSSN